MKRKALLFVLLLLISYSFVQYTGANQRSRFDLVLAMANEHSFVIDRYAENTVDKSFYDGHYYSDKAPGVSFLGLPAYLLMNRLQRLDEHDLWIGYPVYLVTVFAVGLPSALLALLVWRFGRELSGEEWWSLAVAGAFAWGTLAWPFATMFYGHQTASLFCFAAFYLIFLVKKGQLSGWALLGAGCLAGLGVVTEYQVAFIVALLFLYALIVLRPRRQVLLYVAGGLPVALALMAYNTVCFGAPHHLSPSFVSEPQWAHSQVGVWGVTVPDPLRLVQLLFGWRGLFVLSPVLVVGVVGLWEMARREEWRWEAGLTVAMFLIFVVANSAFYSGAENYIFGGYSPGARYLIPVLPFLMAPASLALPRWWALFLPLAVLSVGVMFLATAANPQVETVFANPLRDYWLSGFLRNEHITATLFSLRFGISRRFSTLVVAGTAGLGWLVFGFLALMEVRGWRGRDAMLWIALVAFGAAWLILAFPINLCDLQAIPWALLG